jgi:hypothetical protein
MLKWCKVRLFHKRFQNLIQLRLIKEPAISKHQTSCEIEENFYRNLPFVRELYVEDARFTYSTLAITLTLTK